METVTIDDVEPNPDEDVHSDRRALAEPLNTTHVAITRYVLEPGERFSGSVHAHVDQEEVFVVLEGEATFEVGVKSGPANGRADDAPETGTPCRGAADASAVEDVVTVGDGEAIRFAPGEFQSGKNDSDDVVVALALGAPRDSEDVRIARIPVLGNRNVECPDCGLDHMQIPTDDDAGLVCPDCGGWLAVE